MKILFAAKPDSWTEYEPHLQAALRSAQIDAHLSCDLPADQVDYIIYAPNSEVQDFTPYVRAKAVLNLWAGVEDVVKNPTLHMPLVRMVDPGLTEGMVEWVTGHVLRHHLGMDAHIHNPGHAWTPLAPPLARNRPVTVLGLGALGTACAIALRDLNFQVTGWSRTQKEIDGLTCLSGQDGLTKALRTAEFVVLLLPNTPATENTLDAAALASMPKGAVIINPGRGPLIDDTALLAALDSGHIAHATLDVFRVEPLPQDHPFWAHPHVTVTPHIASETRADTAAERVIENIQRIEAGQNPIGLVNIARGY